VLAAVVLRGELRQQGVWDTAFMHPHTGNLVHLSDSPRFLLAYLSAAHGPLLGLAFFTAAAGCIVAGFLAYQLHLVCAGLTTSEVHRRRVAATAAALEQEAAEVEARVARALAGGAAAPRAACAAAAGQEAAAEASAQLSGTAGGGRRVPRRQPHPYDRGMWRNLSEVLFPHRHLRAAAAAAAARAAAMGSDGGDRGGGPKKRS
jgi:palmitoyltransferase